MRTKLRVGTIANHRAHVSSGGSNANENASTFRLSFIVGGDGRSDARCARGVDEERVADADEAVGGSDRARARSTTRPIGPNGATNSTRSIIRVPSCSGVNRCSWRNDSERTLSLLVDETLRPIPLGDHARHGPRPAEMAGPPRHELSLADLPPCPCHRSPPRANLRMHRHGRRSTATDRRRPRVEPAAPNSVQSEP